MIEAVIITLLPLGFLVVLFGGGALFRRRHVDMDGDPPIGKALFLSSKYLIVLLWAAMIAHGWGLDLSLVKIPPASRWAGLSLWIAGFLLLFTGRLGLGGSFRIGSPQERTDLRVGGLFRFSRNPMYLGVYATLLASILYTLNPLLLILAAYVILVHHKIVLAEERYLGTAFGEPYREYCGRVRRYL